MTSSAMAVTSAFASVIDDYVIGDYVIGDYVTGDYSHQCLASVVDTSISEVPVVRELDRLIAWHERPPGIVCDNGTEFTSMAMFEWSKPAGIGLRFIQPGKPNENALIESFNGRQRDKCMNKSLFSTLKEALEIIK